MSLLRHLDYQGEVEFEDDRLIIRILHIDDFITTEVDSASAAQAAFVELVDDYLVSCAEVGKEPNKPFKGSFNIRMTPKLHKQIALAAAADGQTLNSFVVSTLEQKLEANKLDEISHNIARTMVEYVVQSQSHLQHRIASQWKFVESEVPPVRKIDVSRLLALSLIGRVTTSGYQGFVGPTLRTKRIVCKQP
jgi:predicted HicB family RNase H-like nuclease